MRLRCPPGPIAPGPCDQQPYLDGGGVPAPGRWKHLDDGSETVNSVCSFIHSSDHPQPCRKPLCSRLCSRHWGDTCEQNRISTLVVFAIQSGCTDNKIMTVCYVWEANTSHGVKQQGRALGDEVILVCHTMVLEGCSRTGPSVLGPEGCRGSS